MRRTLSDVCVFEGVGVHTGRASRVAIRPAERCGIVFCVGGEMMPITSARRGKRDRSTEIIFQNGVSLRTVEHFLSAMMGLAIDDAIVECDGCEMPILDGSAKQIVDAMLAVGIRETDGERTARAVLAPIVVERGRAFAAAFPSRSVSFTYIIDYPGTAIGTEMIDVELDVEGYVSKIAPARTFALASEIDALRRAGLALGGTLDNALVVREDGLEGGAELRVPHEFAAHKVLDFIGDLALLGAIPTARYVCARGGHGLHAMLVDRLRGTMCSAG